MTEDEEKKLQEELKILEDEYNQAIEDLNLPADDGMDYDGWFSVDPAKLVPGCPVVNNQAERMDELSKTNPDYYAQQKQNLEKSSRLYEAPKEDKPYDYDSDWD